VTTESLPEHLTQAIAEAVRVEIAKIVPELRQATAKRPSTRFVTVNETLRQLNCSRTQLYRLFGEKKLTPIKRGRSTLLDPDDIDRYVAKLHAGEGAAHADSGSGG
jgi:AraC-like DNA-binding protein